MSTKTTFKRIALVAVAALGLGVLSVAPSQATLYNEVLAIDSATDSITVRDTATAVITHTWQGTASESTTILSSCTAVDATGANAACTGTITYWVTDTSDTANIMARMGPNPTYVSTFVESTTVTANTLTTSRAVINAKVAGVTAAGTQTIVFYTKNNADTSPTGKSVTWTVTVAAENTTATAVNTYVSSDEYTAYNARVRFGASGSYGSDSAIVASAGTVATPVKVANMFFVVKNSAGDTTTATGTAITNALVATVSGPGLVTTALAYSAKAKSATTASNNTVGLSTTETLTVWSDGTPGIATITISTAAGAVVATKTITFTGPVASLPQIYLTDSRVTVGQTGASILKVKALDSASNAVSDNANTLYVYSSDTNVVGPNASATLSQASTCSTSTAGLFSCALTIKDSGTVTLTVRDSNTVAASVATSAVVTLVVTGSNITTLTATWDKASYVVGEQAILTLTANDQKGSLVAANGASTFNSYSTAYAGQFSTTSTGPIYTLTSKGTSLGNTETTFFPYLDTGVETRVITMPSVAGSVAITFASVTGTSSFTALTASVAVTNPAETAAQASKDAADAATDAALEATDAAYAATDAANIAAEAADAATAAAEAATEAANAAKESADAATAAVEELATSVAKLMAALQAQITTLAKVVAKIAVKVKA